MQFAEFQEFLKRADERVTEKYGENKDTEEKILAMMVKLMEEVGELAEQVGIRRGRQEERKGSFEKENIAEEIADVIIVVSMIAQALNVTVEEALQGKMEKIKKKFG